MKTKDSPHYEIGSLELAAWLEELDPPAWWSVDGDPYLTGLISFPCPGDRIAKALRSKERRLLLLDKDANPDARGQRVSAEELNRLAFQDQNGDRVFQLCWKESEPEVEYGSDVDWNLVEDKESAESFLESTDSPEDEDE